MKKFIALLFIAVLTVASLVLCGNKDLFDTVYTYDEAIISLSNGEVIEGKVKKWTDYESDQIQVELEDGKIYLVHSSNIALIQKQ